MKAIAHLLFTWFLLIGGSLFILASPWIILRQHHLFELLEENPYLAIQLDLKGLLSHMLVLMLFGVAAIFVGTHLRHGEDTLPISKGYFCKPVSVQKTAPRDTTPSAKAPSPIRNPHSKIRNHSILPS